MILVNHSLDNHNKKQTVLHKLIHLKHFIITIISYLFGFFINVQPL